MEGFDSEYEKNSLRTLQWFSKKTELLINEEELKDIDLMDLRQIFGITDAFILPEGLTHDEAYDAGYNPYMIASYQVDVEKAVELQKYVKHRICLDKYDYFIAVTSREP